MEVTKLFWLGGLIAGTTYISTTYTTSYAFSRPIETSTFTLALTAFALFATSRLPSRFISYSRSSLEEYSVIPFTEKDNPHASRRRDAHKTRPAGPPLSLRRLRITFFFVIIGICLRVEILRQVINHAQCAKQGWAAFIPLGVALYERWTEPILKESKTKSSQSFLRQLLSSRLFWSISSAVLLGAGAYLTASASAMPHSTYICPHIGPYRRLIPLLQIIGVILDVLVLIGVGNLVFKSRHVHVPTSGKAVSILGMICNTSWALLVVVGLNPWITQQYRWWQDGYSSLYMKDTAALSTIIAITVTCASQVLCWLGPTRLACWIVYIATWSSFISRAWTLIGASVIRSSAIVYLALSGVALLVNQRSHVFASLSDAGSIKKMRPRRGSLPSLMLFLTAFVLPYTLWTLRNGATADEHPVHMLIADAIVQHDAWAHQASTSKTLYEAGRQYRLRYGRDPPPHFDLWYMFAILKKSVIIDDYDNIYDDLLPFWAMKPHAIRDATMFVIANPWNDITGISIRSGEVKISAGTPESHYWMMEGIAKLIEPFSQWLPDMDLAFNLNDEPRVAVPHERLAHIVTDAKKAFKAPMSGTPKDFSLNRAPGFTPNEKDLVSGATPFIERSWHATWEEFGTIVCPASSPASRHHMWDTTSSCVNCLQPHTFQGYISNWTLAASQCHQPDLAHLQGLHISPAAFKASHALMPVFSQSKAAGYNDILYPSAWNYLDKAVYAPSKEMPDPPFTQKEQTFFWRGATSEGVSAFDTGAWQGMVRQRLAWFFNNATAADGYQSTVFLPATPGTDYTRHTFAPREVLSRLRTKVDVHIVADIARCSGKDCDIQYKEFQPQYTQPVDFQQHWKYKYLMDVDGAGFSGRFIPFLQSHSLVMKAGLFREWWDGRVHAWKHFVPVDIRLHELASLISYFGGWWDPHHRGSTKLGRMDFIEHPHDEEAEAIAEAGREWANKVLRKEDMEVYMFRLLLEWGRLTDDNRDELGWRDDAGSGHNPAGQDPVKDARKPG